MATYTIGNATWTNGSHRVTFSALATRPAVFVGCYDNNGASSGYHVIVGSTDGLWTTNNTLDDPTASYTTYGTNQRLLTCNTANSGTYVTYVPSQQGVYPYGDIQAARSVAAGANKVSILLYTVGNTVAGGWTLRVTPASGPVIDVALPATTNSAWTELELALPSSTTSYINNISIRKTTGFFAVGDAIAVSTAYIHSDTTNVIRLADTVSPNGGTTNFTVDKVVNNADATGTLYVVYTKEAYTGTTGTYSTTRTESIVGKDLSTASITGTSTHSATLSRVRSFAASIASTSGFSSVVDITRGARYLTGTVTGASVLSSVLSSTKILAGSIAGSSGMTAGVAKLKDLVAGVFGSSTVSTSLTTTPEASGFSLGNAVWTNGSKVVTFTTANTHVVMLEDFYPYSTTETYTGNNRPVGLIMQGEWGTGGPDVGGTDVPVGTHVYTDSTLERRTTAITYANPYAFPDYAPTNANNATDAMRVNRVGSSTFLNSTGLQKLVMSASFSPGSRALSVSASSAVSGVVTSNAVNLGVPHNGWYNYVLDIPNNISTFKQLSVFHTVDNTYQFAETAIIDSIYLTDTSNQAILPSDTITVGGSGSGYRFAKMTQSSTGAITLYLTTPYTGVTGTYDTWRSPSVWRAAVRGNVSISGTQSRLKGFIADVVAASTAFAGGLYKEKFFTGIVSGVNVINGLLGKMPSLAGQVSASSTGSALLGVAKGFISTIVGTSALSAVEYIRWKFMTGAVAAQSQITDILGKIRYNTAVVATTSEITSFRTRLIFYTSTVLQDSASIITTTLGYVTLMSDAAISGIAALSAGATNVWRGISSTITGNVTIETNIIKSLQYVANIDNVSEVSAQPSFIVGIMPTTITATSGFLPAHITKHSFIDTVIAGSGTVFTSGEFLPVSLFTAEFSASSEITAHLVEELKFGTTIVSATEINGFLNRHRPMAALLDSTASVKGWLGVPEALRELLITASGVVIGPDAEGNVQFSTVENSGYITVRGISIVQLNDVTKNTTETIVVLN